MTLTIADAPAFVWSDPAGHQEATGLQGRLVDLAQLSLADQIQLVAAETNILVGDAHRC